MAKMLTLIDDFSVGEVSPLTEAKISSDEFKDGLRESTNMVPDSHGPVIGRPGFRHVRPVSVPQGNSATLFDINYSPEIFFTVILYDLYIEINDKEGQIIYEGATVFTDKDLHDVNGNEHLAYAFISPAGKELIVLTGEHPPYIVTLTEGDPWTATFTEITFVAGEPAVWGPGNYPTTGTYFQGRTWWAGCRDDQDTLWASKSNDHFDLAYGTPPEDSDGIEFQISKHGRIRWVQGGRSLLIGTEGGEFICTSDTGVITPSDIRVELQSAYGSKRLQSELIGNEVVYVTSDGRKMRSMWWKWVESGWVSLDATFTAEHMTRAGISEIAFARNPYSNVWALLRDGDLIACSYRREKDQDPIVGWFRVRSDHMKFVAITTVENLGTSDLWAIVKSTEDPAAEAHLVRYAPHDYLDDDQVFMDDYSVVLGPTSMPNFAGKFFGTTVTVVADGFHIPDATLNPDGTITLPFVADVVIAGYPYLQRIETMPLIKVSKEGGGSATHHMKRWNKVFLRLLLSYMPTVNGERPPERNVTTNDDTPEPFVNSFIQITPGFGWDRDGILIIEQELPFRTIITGIYGEVGTEIV